MKTLTTTLATIAIATVVLTGCSAGTPSLTPTFEPNAATSTPTVQVRAYATGELVDAETAAELKDAREGQHGYPLDDGTFVVVNKTEPLPSTVLADVQAKTAAAIATVPSLTDDSAGASTILGQAQGYVSKNTGKRVLIVWAATAYWSSYSEVQTTQWIVSGGPLVGEHYDSSAEMQAAAEAWVAGSSSTPNEYVIINVG